jgi:zinc D-Ala-D-Ala carboxypeptidase
MDWSKYPNFSEAELRCSETGECKMQTDFMRRLQALREDYGKPMTITSGYRSPQHSIEASKKQPGTHARGLAVDIAVAGQDCYELMALAMKHGFTGIGVAQKGAGRFLHIDTFKGGTRPNVWSY